MAGQAAAESRRHQLSDRAYTYKAGDFRLLTTPSLGLQYNDNVRLQENDAEDDFILSPRIAISASYPLTQRNLLQLNLGFGYNYYFSHSDLSRWNLTSGSELAFDFYVGDFWFNLHDRFSYSQNAYQQPEIAGTGEYGTFENIAGFSTTWDLQDVTATVGYDHLTDLSIFDNYDYRDHASELFTARAGLKLHPTLVAGVEGTTSLTSYDQPVLNDSTGYSLGAYADWKPGHYFSLQPRLGYTIYDFDQTSVVLPAEDQDAWYVDLTLRHAPTEVVSYSISAGHELRLGIQSDMIDAYYVRPAATWSIFKDVTLNTNLFYEHGSQEGGGLGSLAGEDYDWFGGSIGFGYMPAKRLRLGLNYRATFRSSNLPNRDYTQNVVGLEVTYLP
jgi:hypothetical protein